ncbi:hypothetical protein Hypma_014256 [Hypsizygus marmoreus]|uniref:Uncharacterized protein n=1 Tax=Hypsizygus marmoreus TaxID=39966 RepID=A0A369JAJ7_HYPMA|nr:hypothetical protein Hypma_014256 [Hypsizygus marmoreus]
MQRRWNSGVALTDPAGRPSTPSDATTATTHLVHMSPRLSIASGSSDLPILSIAIKPLVLHCGIQPPTSLLFTVHILFNPGDKKANTLQWRPVKLSFLSRSMDAWTVRSCIDLPFPYDYTATILSFSNLIAPNHPLQAVYSYSLSSYSATYTTTLRSLTDSQARTWSRPHIWNAGRSDENGRRNAPMCEI